jgi:hypothetical protein
MVQDYINTKTTLDGYYAIEQRYGALTASSVRLTDVVVLLLVFYC